MTNFTRDYELEIHIAEACYIASSAYLTILWITLSNDPFTNYLPEYLFIPNLSRPI